MVCPTSLVANWEREVIQFVPGAVVRRYHGAARSLETSATNELVITTYGVLRRDVDALAAVGWGLSSPTRPSTPRTQVPHGPGAAHDPRAGSRIALTGTPVENRLTELWSILDWTDARPARHARNLPAHGRDARSSATTTRRSPMRSPGCCAPFLLRRRKTDPASRPSCRPRPSTTVVVPLTGNR